MSSIGYSLAYEYSEDSNQSVHSRSLIRILNFSSEETLNPWLPIEQGCGNTMPDLSDLVPFHSGQVEISNLLVLGQVQNLL